MTHPLVTADVRFAVIPEWVLDADISPGAVRLYAVLARFADNETLIATRGRKALADRMRCALKSLDRYVSELESIGAVTVVRRERDISRYALHQVHQETLFYPSDKNDPSDKNIPPTERKLLGVSSSGSSASQRTDSPASKAAGAFKIADAFAAFDAFWKLYPRKRDVGHARSAFIAGLKKAPLPEIMAGLDRALLTWADAEPRFIPYAATWLRGEGWLDEPGLSDAERAERLTEQILAAKRA